MIKKITSNFNSNVQKPTFLSFGIKNYIFEEYVLFTSQSKTELNNERIHSKFGNPKTSSMEDKAIKYRRRVVHIRPK